MALHRQNPKRDANENAIILALRAVGAKVRQLSDKGIPDLLVGFHAEIYLLEVKQPKGVLTPDQIEFAKEWEGYPVHVVRSVSEALQVIGAVEVEDLLA